MKELLSICIFTLLTTLLSAQVTKTLNLTTQGTLSTMLTTTEKATITDLTVTGNIDARDIKCMRDEILLLENLDLRSVVIQAYNGQLGTNAPSPDGNYPANEMPKRSFHKGDGSGKTTLKTILLPDGITSIGTSAFFSCLNINTMFLPKQLSNITPSAFNGCIRLNEFIVATDNLNFISIDGAVYNKNATNLILYPPGRQGTFNIPNTVTKINSSACYNHSNITTLILPVNLTIIGTYAFADCKNLKKIYCQNIVPPTLDGSCFSGASVTEIYVPTDEAVLNYNSNTAWYYSFLLHVKKGIINDLKSKEVNKPKIVTENLTIMIEGVDFGEIVTLYTLNGKQIRSVMSKGERLILTVDRNTIYLVKTGEKIFKVFM